MRIVLLGAPGSGKGTQGEALAEHFGGAHVSSGDLFRKHIAEGTELGVQVADYVARGDLVPDDLVLAIIGAELARVTGDGRGYVLDGFPRTLVQAERAYELAELTGQTADAVVYLAVPDDVARERLAGRAAAGRVDDNDAAAIERRLRLFHEATEPLLDFYRDRGILVTVDATPPPGEVTKDMLAAVSDVA
jgi:adenylate kinase